MRRQCSPPGRGASTSSMATTAARLCVCVCVIYVHAASDRENDLVCARLEGGKILVFNIELREQRQIGTAGDANDCLSTAA